MLDPHVETTLTKTDNLCRRYDLLLRRHLRNAADIATSLYNVRETKYNMLTVSAIAIMDKMWARCTLTTERGDED
jgi:hypothetical protein|tara:strand:+ start:9430 stop:9654 length:225 start_codon:yes stop_codon:yes gene_type:complete